MIVSVVQDQMNASYGAQQNLLTAGQPHCHDTIQQRSRLSGQIEISSTNQFRQLLSAVPGHKLT